MKKTFFLFAAAAALMTSCGQKGGMNFGDDEYPVETVKTSYADMQATYPATVKGIQDVEIRPKISGNIVKINVHEGQHVSAGQVLFVIDNETYQAQVRQAQAGVQAAQAGLQSAQAGIPQANAAVSTARAGMATAKLTYENAQKLFANKVIGQFELQTAKNSYESAQAAVRQAESGIAAANAAVAGAKAQIAQAQAGLASARETLSFCYVKSPCSGVVGTLPYKVGALVSGSIQQPLTTISNSSMMEVYFSLTEKDLISMTREKGSAEQALKSFPTVQLQLADGTMYGHDGHVAKMSGIVESSTGSVQVIAQFDNTQGILRSGGTASIVIPNKESAAIMIPQSATVDVQNKHFVYVVGADNKVKYTEITIDPKDDGKSYIVRSGLRVGDKIVTKGITKLQNGMEIKPITAAQYEKKLQQSVQMSREQGKGMKL